MIVRTRSKGRTGFGHKRPWAYVSSVTGWESDGLLKLSVNRHRACALAMTDEQASRVISQLQQTNPGNETEPVR